MKNRLAVLPLCLWVPFLIFAQDGLLKGKLIDAQTIEPLAFATVRVKGRAIGAVSNLDGSFKIPEKFRNYGDTLEISSMGYKKRSILISTLSTEKARRIFIEPGVFELQETVVKARRRRRLSARQIVRRAIRNIPKNYPMSSFSTIGYYRDYQLRQGEYVNLNEAILEVFDQGFDTNDYKTTRAKIYDYNENNDFVRDSLALQPYDYRGYRKVIDNAFLYGYGGNEFVILRIHDALRNYNMGSYSFVERFDTDVLKNHGFSKAASTFFDDVPLYVIEFKRSLPKVLAYGRLYISQNDFSVYKMHYSIYDRGRPGLALGKDKNGIDKKLIFEVTTEYKRLNGKMYLNYISLHNTFKVLKAPKFAVEDIALRLDRKCFVVTFNNVPLEEDAKQLKNYKAVYKGKKIRFGKLVLLDRQVLLFPTLEREKEIELFDQIAKAARRKEFNSKLLVFEISGIRDLEGNVINRGNYDDFNQFREYFVQHTKPDHADRSNGPFMKNDRPIFKNQPIVSVDNFDDYWMNTPLQKFQ